MDEQREQTLKKAEQYLNAKGVGSLPPEGWEQLLQLAYENMRAAAAPRHVLRRAALRMECSCGSGDEDKGYLGDMPPFISRDLCRLLAGCTEGYAFLATLGMELDLRIRYLLPVNPGLAMAVSACGSAYLEVYIDDCIKQEEALLKKADDEENGGIRFTRRFSPGYGDAPLSMQPAMIRFLGGQKLGVRLTEGMLMIPEKSVTALFGITPEPAVKDQDQTACGICAKRDCAFREE